MENFEDYEYIINSHRGLVLLADSLSIKGLAYLDKHQTSKTRNGDMLTPLLDNLKHMADIVVFSKIIVFMKYTLDAPKKEEILFSNVITEERINKRYKKLGRYFHPDKANLNKLHEEKGNEYFKASIDYRNAYKAQWDKLKLFKKEDLIKISSEELKGYSISYGQSAYEEYRAACKLADNNKQLKCQIKLRRYMALSLYISNKPLEAQLYALAAIKLVYKAPNTTQLYEDLCEAKKIFDRVKRDLSGSENVQSSYELIPSNSLVKTGYSFIEIMNNHRLINDVLEKISSELLLSADRSLVRYQANKEEILKAKRHAMAYKARGRATQGLGVSLEAATAIAGLSDAITAVTLGTFIGASIFATAGISVICLGLYCGLRLKNRGDQLLEEPKIREILNDIMIKALHAYDKKEYQEFFEELSKPYKTNCRLLKLVHRGDSVNHENIIKELIEHGFRSDGIAYLLILISEVLISGKIKIPEIDESETITSKELKEQGYLLLNGVLSKRLEDEARELDDRIRNLREKTWSSVFWRTSDFIKIQEYSSIAREYIKDAEEMPFTSRLEEMRNIARINLTIRDILDNGPAEIKRAKKVIEKVRESIDNHRRYYIGMAETRLEALEDLFWVISGESIPDGYQLVSLQNIKI